MTDLPSSAVQALGALVTHVRSRSPRVLLHGIEGSFAACAIARRVIPRSELGKLSDIVLPEQELAREQLLGLLTRAGYGRSQVVEDPGTFAVRGGVIDVFSPLYRFPARIELFGDLVESIRF